jgi:hypothetical protein
MPILSHLVNTRPIVHIHTVCTEVYNVDIHSVEDL